MSDHTYTLDMIAQRYGRRPSEMIGIPNEAAALDFDIAIAMKTILRDSGKLEKEEEEVIDFTPIVNGKPIR
jgi:hypothetical protein